MSDKITINPFTGKPDFIGGGGDDAAVTDFIGATPISNGTYWAKIAQFDIVCGQNLGYECIAMFHVMRMQTVPYSFRSDLGVQEATIYAAVSSLHKYGEHSVNMVIDGGSGISKDDIMLIRQEYTESKQTFCLWLKLTFNMRGFFVGRWNQLDKNTVNVTLGTVDDALVGGFNPTLPTYYPELAGVKEYEVVQEDVVIINHNLAKYPAVIIMNSDGEQVLADVKYNSRSQVEITFTELFTGTIVLS